MQTGSQTAASVAKHKAPERHNKARFSNMQFCHMWEKIVSVCMSSMFLFMSVQWWPVG